MIELAALREKYGEVFVSETARGDIIPWRPLSIEEFLKYDEMARFGQYPQAFVENEIFRTCVLNPVLAKHVDQIPAGVVSQVSSAIFVYSGPQNIQDLAQVLDLSRAKARSSIHQIVSFITQAFPAYTPEDVYAMDYSTMMMRAAQAEEKMLRMGLITEPLEFFNNQEEAQQAPPQPQPQMDPRELKQRYEEQVPGPPAPPKREKIEVPKDIPKAPTLKPTEQTIITKHDVAEHESLALEGHMQDLVELTKEADKTAEIYKDYLNEKDGKIVIKTPEERKAEAIKRMEENKKKNHERQLALAKDMIEERKQLLDVKEKAKLRKQKKRRR